MRVGLPISGSRVWPLLLLLSLTAGGCGGVEPPDGTGAADDAAVDEAEVAPVHAARDPAIRESALRPGGEDREVAPSWPDTLVGVVQAVGTVPTFHLALLLSREEGQPVVLGRPDGSIDPEADPEHPLAELANLVGATVSVVGVAHPGDRPPHFAVTGYALLLVEGAPARTGRLERRAEPAADPARPGSPSGDRLHPDEGGGAWTLLGLPSGTPRDGTRIWVIGTVRSDTILVEGFGVLRAPPSG